jgi:hypothetical protein
MHDPMGRLDAFDVGAKKLTIQTEYFASTQRIETKVYLGGALKKVFTENVGDGNDENVQARIDAYHKAKIDEIVEGLRARKA